MILESPLTSGAATGIKEKEEKQFTWRPRSVVWEVTPFVVIFEPVSVIRPNSRFSTSITPSVDMGKITA